MISLLGIKSEQLDLQIEKYIGTLLFAEFSTTVIYSDKEDNPIIKEWVDCSEDGEIDRYFYFKSSNQWLKKFIKGKISHQDLILESLDGLLYFQDEQNSEPINNFVISSKILPNQYKPSSDFYLKESDAQDLNEIVTYFKLNKVTPTTTTFEKVKEISLSKKTETLNLHLLQGSDVGKGTINTGVLGQTLSKFDKFYKDIALDYLKGKTRGDILKSKTRKDELNPFISTEIYGSMAASYSVLLRPKAPRFELFSETTDTENIAGKIFNLILNSNNIDLLTAEYIHHSDYSINSYKNFLKSIYESKVNLDLNWFSPLSKKEFKEKISFKNANSILKILESLNIINEDKFLKTGKFRAINCDTGHFTFISNEDEQFTGYFDKLVKGGSELINFINIYNIKINRKIIKAPGRTEAKIEDTVIAFYDIE